MSKIALEGNASGTGTFTLASPNSSTDRTLTLPDEAGTVLTSASTVAASQITSALNATGSAPIYACRAWVNFNGTGTVAIRASGNVTSITDNGTGDYTVNFTTAMPDANFSVAGMPQRSSAGGTSWNGLYGNSGQTQTTTTVRLIHLNAANVLEDAAICNIVVFR